MPLSGTEKESSIENQNYTYMTRRIGNSNYRIKVYLSDTATETFEEKILRLVRNDSFAGCTESERNEKEAV